MAKRIASAAVVKRGYLSGGRGPPLRFVAQGLPLWNPPAHPFRG
jgi:hypothetical protein